MTQDKHSQNLHLPGGRRYVASLGSLLIVIVLAITGFLNISSFQSSYINSLVSSYGVAGSEARRTIEYSVKYHKPLNNFAGMGDILGGIKKALPSVDNVYLLLPTGVAINDTSGRINKEILSSKFLSKVDFSGKSKDKTSSWLLIDQDYHAFIPIKNDLGEWIGTLDIVFSEQSVAEKISAYMYSALGVMLGIALLAILALFVVVYRIPLFDHNYQLRRRTLMIAITVILGVSQVSYAVINVITFRNAYLKIVDQNLNIAADIIGKQIDRVVKLGLPYQELDGVDDWLENLVGPVKEIDHVDLRDSSGKLLFSSRGAVSSVANTQQAASPTTPSAAVAPAPNKETLAADGDSPLVTRALTTDGEGQSATLTISVSQAYVDQKLIDLALDALTMFVTSIFFLFETLVFIIILLTNYTNKLSISLLQHDAKKEAQLERSQNENCVRVLGFLLLLSSFMSISFIPLLMKEIYQPLWGLTPDVIFALPIAAEMLGAFLSSLLVGYAIDRYGWRPVFVGGFIVLASGTLLSAFAQEPISFIAMRCIVGLGYGAAWMGLRGLVAAANTPHQRASAFSILNAGIFAGQNCGAVLGALLAQRIGFPAVLVLASFLILVAMPFTYLLTINSKPAISGEKHLAKGAVGRFFGDKDIFLFFLLITIPSAITSSFLNYFFPVYANSINISQGNIGRGFLLYGICIVFIGPYLNKRLKSLNQEKWMIIGSCLCGVLALSVFWLMPTLVGLLLALLILGIGDSVGLVSQNNYFISLPRAEKLGHGKALSFYSAVKKVGQLVGPAAFGVALSFGAVTGVGMIACGYLLTSCSFGLLNRKTPPTDITQ